jgi:predicted dehydrogenase
MGKRRIRNLQKLGYKKILGFDVRSDRIQEVSNLYKISTFSNMKDALKQKPNVIIISTPPNLHKEYANIAIKNKINFFMELNLFSKDVKKIIKFVSGKDIKAFPSCTMKFHPVVKKLKKLLESQPIGKILMIEHHSGFFLPYWHPWEDYKTFFASKKETGGAKELFPIDLMWITSLFTDVKSVHARVGKISNLDVNIDDFYTATFELENGIICNYTTDVFSIPPFKQTKIFGENGQIICNFHQGIIEIKKDKTCKIFNVKLGEVAKGYKGTTPPETLYEDELQSFFDALKGNKYPLTLEDELKLLKILDAVEISSKRGRRINLSIN